MSTPVQPPSTPKENGLDQLQPVFDPAPPLGDDQLASREASSLAAGVDLETDGKHREHKRHQKFRDHINRATLWIFWIIVLGIIAGVVTYAWHLLTPDQCHYLSEKQLDKLQTLLASAVLSSSLTAYVNKRMN